VFSACVQNLLSGRKDLFEVAHGNLPCTQGVFISEMHEDGATFRRRASLALPAEAGAADGSQPQSPPSTLVTSSGKAYAASATVSYVDVEGLGDKGKAYDVHLIAPLLLVSKCLMYNWKGAPNKHVMLESLLTLGEAAQRVHLGDRNQTETESASEGDGGGDGSSSKKTAPIFGHLVIVLRDWATTDNVFELLFHPEPERPGAPDDAVKARNRARALVVDAFESITVKCLPYPGLESGDTSMTQLSQEFVESYLALQGHLVDLTQSPKPVKLFNNRPLDGPAISTLLPLLANKLNQDEDLLPKEVWRLMEEHRLHNLVAGFKAAVKTWVETRTEAELPCTLEVFEALNTELRGVGEDQMKQLVGLNWLSDETEASAREEYGAYMEEQAGAFKRRNEEARAELTAKVTSVVAAAVEALREELKKEVKPTLPVADATALAATLTQRQEAARAKLVASEQELEATAQRVLDLKMTSSFEEAAAPVAAALAKDNEAIIGRAETARLRVAADLTTALQALRRGAEATPTPEATVLAGAKSASESAQAALSDALAFVVHEYSGRASFVTEQQTEAAAASEADLAEVATSWPKQRDAHLAAASASAVAELQTAAAAKIQELPLKSGALEIWCDQGLKKSMAALEEVAKALSVYEEVVVAAPATNAEEGGSNEGAAAGTTAAAELTPFAAARASLSSRVNEELRAIRAKNAELLRAASPPDAAHMGKLVGGDETIQCVMVVPQPNTRFSVAVDALELDRVPSTRAAPLQWPVTSGDVTVECNEADLTNGKAYTFKLRARNANGWGPWSSPSTATPFGKPGAPVLASSSSPEGGVLAGSKCITFTLDSALTINGGSPITGLRVAYQVGNVGAGETLLTPEAATSAPDQPSGTGSAKSPPSPPLSFVLSGLTNGVEYTFELRCENSAGTGPPLGAVRATPAAVPMRPKMARVVPMDGALQVVLAADASTSLVEAGSPPVTTFRVSYRQMLTYQYGKPVVEEFPADAVNAFILRGLTNGTDYSVSVEARNAIGWSPPCGAEVVAPNTKWGTFKKMFAFCSGPAASKNAVVGQPPNGNADDTRNRSATAAVELGDVY